MATRLNLRELRGIVGVVIGVGMILMFAHSAKGQLTYELLHAFAEEGSTPNSPLIQGRDGNFYGTTEFGRRGEFGGGTVFKMTPTGILTTLHAFNCFTEGCGPHAGLIQASDDHFYGTTAFGGGAFQGGTVFRITAAGAFTTLHSFDCSTDGCVPEAGLIQARDGGDLYGTTSNGGAFGGGTVFKITTHGDDFTTLHSFDCRSEGCIPLAGLIQASDDHFYGTTLAGGTTFSGTVFRITADRDFRTLHSFVCGIEEGCQPHANLIQASDGHFYGTTSLGGTTGRGTVFRITADPDRALKTLYSFDCNKDGCSPRSGLIQASDEHFYGTTPGFGRGLKNGGTVFRITAAGDLTTLYFVDGRTDGFPSGSLVQANGDFYGALGGGPVPTGEGTIFRMTAAGAVTTLFTFPCNTEPCLPGHLLQAGDGNFYGTTEGGGARGGGTVFKLTAGGPFTTLHSFDCRIEGCVPSSLIQARDGDFYGTTQTGKVSGDLPFTGGGTVFKLTADGTTFTTLHSFDCRIEGCIPSSLIQASDGHFYGTTSGGGAFSGGTIFRMTAAGTVTTLYSFINCGAQGCFPTGLIQASDGHFYGTTCCGGAFGGGTIFKSTSGGTVTTLHTFNCATHGCPSGALIQASDGAFYGTTSQGGRLGGGTVFRLTSAGTFTTLHSFDCNAEGCAGQGFLRDKYGNLYGTVGGGSVFKIGAAGKFTIVFACSECSPSTLIQASDGNLYGTATFGPKGGTLFRLIPPRTAGVWIGLKTSDDAGLRLDLLAEVFVDGAKVGEGRLENVSAGSSGFNNALLNTIVLDGPGEAVTVASALAVKVSVRRTCSGGGHASGVARLWYNGRPIDGVGTKDAGSRIDVIAGGRITDYFLRGGFALSTTSATARQSIDVSVDSKQACPDRAFKSFGTWTNTQ